MPLLLSGALAQLQLRLAGRRGRSAELRKILVSTSGIAVSDESRAGVRFNNAGRALHPADGDHLLNTHQ